MKHLLLPALLALCCLGATTNQLSLSWDNSPDYDESVTFHVYTRTNIAGPPWLPLTNISWLEWTNTGKIAIGAASDDRRFFSVTASNFTGESDFSLPVSVRRLPRAGGLKIGVSQSP